MQSDNPFVNDFTKMMGGFLGTAQGIQKEATSHFEAMVQKYILEAGFVAKEDFEALEMRVNTLIKRIETLEQKSSSKS